jgi:hypothetical protein
MARAKTFKSEHPHFFTKPQGLSGFGIPIPGAPADFTLGLEEFNFCDILKEFTFDGKHVAYIPAYSCENTQANPGIFDSLDLFFHNGNNGGTTHYATMYKVSRIPDNPITIQAIREQLINAGFPLFVNAGAPWPNYAPIIHATALVIWNNNFTANQIIAPEGINRFAVNMFYETIEIHNPLIINQNWQNNNYACNFYQ